MTPVFCPPRITPARFARVLVDAKSPVLDEAPARVYWDILVGYGADPAVFLAIFGKESSYGTNPKAVVQTHQTKNWGNTRTLVAKVPASYVDVPDRGRYVRFQTWADGLRDCVERLTAPWMPYAQAGAVDVETIIPIFAPKTDKNDPVAYIAYIVARLAEWAEGGRMVRIALSAGHHNTDGGNQFEHDTTGPLCKAIAAACRLIPGADVRVITPQDGLGDSPGGLQAVARQVVTWAAQGWTADLFLECHTEGVGNPNVKGAFAIYPDWGGDVDGDVRDRLGPAIVRKVAQYTGLAIRGSGVMSERQTGVGLDGYRLGIFGVTQPLAATTTRLIVEYGAHSNPQEAAIQRTPAFYLGAARATAEAIAEFYGVQAPVDPPVAHDGPGQNPLYFPATGFWLDERMADFYFGYGGLPSFGMPLEGSHLDGDGVVRQVLENVMLEVYPGGTVRLGGLGQMYMGVKRG